MTDQQPVFICLCGAGDCDRDIAGFQHDLTAPFCRAGFNGHASGGDAPFRGAQFAHISQFAQAALITFPAR